MPVAGTFICKKVTSIELQGGTQLIDRLARRPLALKRATCCPDTSLEDGGVDLELEIGVDDVPAALEQHHIAAPQRSPQLVQRDVEVVLRLSGRRIWPHRGAYLLACSSGRMNQQIRQQLTRP